MDNVFVAGKTGTAEFCEYIPEEEDCRRDDEDNLPTHAWFTAFAPYDDPEIAVVTFVYDGGEGSATAAPIAKTILGDVLLGGQSPLDSAPRATPVSSSRISSRWLTRIRSDVGLPYMPTQAEEHRTSQPEDESGCRQRRRAYAGVRTARQRDGGSRR